MSDFEKAVQDLMEQFDLSYIVAREMVRTVLNAIGAE